MSEFTISLADFDDLLKQSDGVILQRVDYARARGSNRKIKWPVFDAYGVAEKNSNRIVINLVSGSQIVAKVIFVPIRFS